MRIDPHRLTLWLALFATGATYLALSPSYRQAMPATRDTPWIGLPDSGMDAGDVMIRELLDPVYHVGRHDDPFRDLVRTCGDFLHAQDSPPADRYILHFSDSAWTARWEVAMDVDKETISFAIRSGDIPPPPPVDDANRPDMITVRPVTQLRIPRSRAEPIRRAWSNEALWHAPQKQVLCNDGAQLILEACVGGRYAIRSRTCDDQAQQAADALRTAVKTLLPAPEPIYQRSAR